MKNVFQNILTLRSRLLLIAILIFTFLTIRSTLNLMSKFNATKEAQSKIAELEKEQAELLKIKEKVDTPEFTEKEAREKLGLAKPGEVVVVLPSDEILRKLAPSLDREEYLEELPIFKRWMRLFF